VIVVQMRAHHQIDLLRQRAGRRQPSEIIDAEHIPPRPARLDLVIAAATVDQDFLAADLQQPAMDAEMDQPALGVVVVRRQPGCMLCHMRVGEFRKNIAQRIAREIGLLDPRDGGFAHFEHRYFLHDLALAFGIARGDILC